VPADLPPSLRRAANSRATRRRPPRSGTRLYDAAETGLLTRSNTKSGTRGRQAVDAAAYRARKATEPTLSPREALGHRVAGSRSKVVTFYTDDPPRRITLEGEGITRREVRRGGTYLHSVRELIADLRRHPRDADRLRREWERRWRIRAPIAGYPFLATADAAIALADQDRQTGEEPIFDSGRSRPGRRRRRPSPRRRR
jgi:hypothetical protein